jgi:hypothetical protein
MAAFTKSTNIINNSNNVFIHHEYLVLVTAIKCICCIEAEIEPILMASILKIHDGRDTDIYKTYRLITS